MKLDGDLRVALDEGITLTYHHYLNELNGNLRENEFYDTTLKMKIYIDGWFLEPPLRGIGNYIKNILLNLNDLDKKK